MKYIDQSNLRFDVGHFSRELLRDKHQTIGRLDGRLTGPSSLNTGETAEYDPSNTLIAPPFTAAFTNYVRAELEYKTDLYYYVSGGIQPEVLSELIDRNAADDGFFARFLFSMPPEMPDFDPAKRPPAGADFETRSLAWRAVISRLLLLDTPLTFSCS